MTRPRVWTGPSGYGNFVEVLPDVIIVAQEVADEGGEIIFEWPSGSYYWNLDVMKHFIQHFKMMAVPINGCMLEHRGRGSSSGRR